jgi:hypothetical protein
MSRRVVRPHQLAWHMFRGADALQAGLVTPTGLRGLAWTRLRYGVYADSRLDRDHRLVCHAAALRLPPDVVIAGRSAAFLHGAEHAASFSDAVHVIVATSKPIGPRAGLRVHRTDLDPDDIEELEWGRRTTPARTAWDIATWDDVPSAVGMIDVMVGMGVLDATALASFCAARTGRRGSRRAQQVCALIDGRAQSPPESHLRVRLVLAGLPPPTPQFPVRLESGHVLHPDLAWPEFMVAVEYDGAWHATVDQLSLDRRRLNQLVVAGWVVLHVTTDRMRRDFAGLLNEVRDALKARGWRP